MDCASSSATYDRLPAGSEGDASEKGEEKPFLPNDEEALSMQQRRNSPKSRYAIIPWVVSTALFASLYIYQIISSGVVQAKLGTYEAGWKTDFGGSECIYTVAEAI